MWYAKTRLAQENFRDPLPPHSLLTRTFLKFFL